MSDKAQEIGIDGLAKAFHRSDKQIRNLLRDGVLPQPIRYSGRRPLYDYWACHHAYIDYQDGQGRQSNIAKKQEEHLEKKNRRLDVEHQERMGQLVNKDELLFSLKDLFTEIRSQVLSIPTKATGELIQIIEKGCQIKIPLSIQTRLQEMLKREVRDPLEALSKWKPSKS